MLELSESTSLHHSPRPLGKLASVPPDPEPGPRVRTQTPATVRCPLETSGMLALSLHGGAAEARRAVLLVRRNSEGNLGLSQERAALASCGASGADGGTQAPGGKVSPGSLPEPREEKIQGRHHKKEKPTDGSFPKMKTKLVILCL